MTDGAGATVTKRELILDAAIDEFSEKGYENASTNAIAKRGKISKGLIFHYYKDKPTLYYHCVKKATELFNEQINYDAVSKEQDIFKRIVLWNQEKRAFITKYQKLNNILYEILSIQLDSPELKPVKEIYEKEYIKQTSFLFNQVDTTNIRAGISQEKAIEFVFATTEVFTQAALKKYGTVERVLAEYDRIEEEFNNFVELVKYGVYEKEQ